VVKSATRTFVKESDVMRLRVFPLRLWAWMVVACVCLATMSKAESPCSTCGDGSPNFPEAASFLQEKGFPPEKFTVLFTWNETARTGARQLVAGYHVQPTDGSPVFDLYGDGANLLDDTQLRALGISKKKWDMKPVAVAPEWHAAPVVSPAAPVAPLGIAKGIAPSVRLDLPPIDIAAVLKEDAAAAKGPLKGAKRIGVFQTLANPIRVSQEDASLGAWETLPDGGRMWSVVLFSPNARGQRVHFSRLSLPEGARIIVYNTGMQSEVYGPYTAPSPGESDLWSSTCFSEAVTVECYAPQTADAPLAVEIDRTIHLYAGFDEVPMAKAAGTCNLDVTCHPEWAMAAKGVGGLGTVGATGYLWCTGSLIADTDPSTSIPYFLTANHCVPGQSAASTTEVYWLYQSSACGGPPPSVYSVPRTTGGADYLAGAPLSSGSDFTLLRLRNTPPSGTSFLGWSALSQPIGTQVTTIHHPRGDYKRISFGSITGNYSGSSTVNVVWSAGTTEQGSSGCPLLANDGQHIIGQLWGGGASCSTPFSPDEFGKFSSTYPVITAWLAAYAGLADVDKSGFVDAADVQIVINAALGLALPPAYDPDLDRSGRVDIVDVQLVIYAALGIAHI